MSDRNSQLKIKLAEMATSKPEPFEIIDGEIMHDEDFESVLKDVGKTGKVRDWKGRKRMSSVLADAYQEVHMYDALSHGYSKEEVEGNEYLDKWPYHKRAESTRNCADVLYFKDYGPDKPWKLYQTWFCKDRLCPMCNWRRSLKLGVQIQEILEFMQANKINGKPIFLTVTLKNVKAWKISETFSHLSESIHRLLKYKEVSSNLMGGLRCLEMTHNVERDDWHIHAHLTLWMHENYYNGRNYISQDRWIKLWKRAAKLDYEPSVDVRAIKPRHRTIDDPTGMMKAVLEVSKYPIKPNAFEFLVAKRWRGETSEQEEEGLLRLMQVRDGIAGKRLVSFFGIFKKIRAQLKQDDTENGDLVETGDGDPDGEVVRGHIAVWRVKWRDYYVMAKKLTPDEINGLYCGWHGNDD